MRLTVRDTSDVIRWGPERARTGRWRGEREIAFLTPVPDGPVPSAAFVRRCMDELAGRGYRRVVTGALTPQETQGFLAAGFDVEQELHLLAHGMRHLAPAPDLGPDITLRRVRRDEWAPVLAVDHAAFPPFWQLDMAGLGDAVAATPRARFQVAVSSASGPDAELVGYCVTGRAGRRGFVQRLAVHPAYQGRSLGKALTLDGLRWLRRWRVDEAVVNTQTGNDRALALYEDVGFRRQAFGLSVLTTGLPAGSAGL